MSTQLAYGSITITDISDVGKLSLYLTSSQPLMVIYDPNAENKYMPDWSSSNLLLTPTIFFNEQQLSLTTTGLDITWKRQAGSGEITSLISGEKVTDGVLTVSSNVLSNIPSGLITYICHVSYTIPDNNMIIETKYQMSYSLVKNASELSDCSIVGDTTFKYNGEGTLISSSSIKLKANLINASMKQWQYKTNTGDFIVYPNSTNSTELTINAADDVFINDVAIIKAITTDPSVYDQHQIVKLRDGAAGSSTITCNLSNDVQSIPCNDKGELYETSLNGCNTVITILRGATDDSSNWNITATPSNGVTGIYDSKSRKYTVTNITADSGYVEFIATRAGYTTITKRFSINKYRSGGAGADAVIYEVDSDVGYMKLNQSKVFVPNSILFSAKKIVGNNPPASYNGRFKIYESMDGTTYTATYTSSSDEHSKSYTPSSNSIKMIKCELYESGNTTTLYDYQTVSIVLDGTDGQPGKAGESAINVVLGNSSEIIPCTSGGLAVENKDITIPFDCYKGASRISGKATIGTLPSGITVKTNTAATNSSSGTIVLSVSKGANLSSSESGDITLTFNVENLTSIHKFTWVKRIQAASGQNAILLQILLAENSPGIIYNNENNVTLKTQLTNGTTIVTSGITYQWSKFTGSNYENLVGETKSTLVVTPDMVESTASFKCTATYNGSGYTSFYVVTDRSDPINVQCYSTLGEQLVNGSGVGAIYALLLKNNGEEVDAIKTTIFSTSDPSNAANGDYYYKINKSTKTVTLMKYNGKSWNAASIDDNPKGVYEWYRRDSSGNILDKNTPFTTGKVIYLDNSIVDKKVILTCKCQFNS